MKGELGPQTHLRYHSTFGVLVVLIVLTDSGRSQKPRGVEDRVHLSRGDGSPMKQVHLALRGGKGL